MKTNEVLRVTQLSINDQGVGQDMVSHAPPKKLLHEMNITLYQGQILAIVGRSGVGKSLSMMSLLAIQEPRFVVSGEVMFCGRVIPIHQRHARAWQSIRGRGIGYLFQDAKNALNPLDTVKTAFDKAFSRIGLAKSSYQSKMIELLQKTHVYHPSLLRRYPHELSGGEAKRVHLALLLALDSLLIIADEPTGHLEDGLKDEMLSLLTHLAKKEGKAVIIVSHDEKVLNHADEIMMMADGRCELIHDKENLDRIFPQSLEETINASSQTPPTTINQYPDDASLLLTVKGLNYHYRSLGLFTKLSSIIKKSPDLIMNVPDFEIHQGQIIGIMGNSGVGKSTLAKLITRLDDTICAHGEIMFYDDCAMDVLRLDKKTLNVYRPKVILMMQDHAGSLNPYLTIAQSVLEGVIAKQQPQKTKSSLEQTGQNLTNLLNQLNLPTNVLQKYPHQLSGGQKARVCLLRALLVRPKLLILDEPSAMLDDDNTWQMMHLLKEMNQTFGTSMLIISHDGRVLQWLCDKIIRIPSCKEGV